MLYSSFIKYYCELKINFVLFKIVEHTQYFSKASIVYEYILKQTYQKKRQNAVINTKKILIIDSFLCFVEAGNMHG